MMSNLRLEDMVRVSFDAALKDVVISRIEQFEDDRHVSTAVAQPCAATLFFLLSLSRRIVGYVFHSFT